MSYQGEPNLTPSTTAVLRALENQPTCPWEHQIFMVFSPQGRCFFASAGARQAFGLGAEGLEEVHFDEFHRDQASCTSRPGAGVCAEQPGFEALIERDEAFEATCVAKGGASHYMSVDVIRTLDLQVVGLLAVYYPLASLRGAFGPEAYAKVLGALDQGVLVLDHQDRLSYVNQKAHELLHGKPGELFEEESCHVSLRTPQGDLLCGESNPFYNMSDALDLPPGQVLLLEFDEHDVRRVMCSFQSVCLPHSEGQHTLLRLEDVTERHGRESQKGELLAIASHELRNPLTPLKGLMQMAVKQAQTVGQVDPRLLEKSLDQVNRMVRLVDSLLDLSQIETGRVTLSRQPVQMGEVVQQVGEMWQMTPQRQGRLHIGPLPQGVRLWLDRSAIEQVLTNVLDNAFKFSPFEGSIFLGAGVELGQARIWVENQSDEVTSEVMDLAFEKFYQGKGEPEVGSLGLGLYISRRIVEEHRGSIGMERLQDPARVRVVVSLPLPAEEI